MPVPPPPLIGAIRRARSSESSRAMCWCWIALRSVEATDGLCGGKADGSLVWRSRSSSPVGVSGCEVCA